jgi:uncharacterized cupin superfamily protein
MTEVTNLLASLPGKSPEEVVTRLLAHSGLRIERIVSTGQATPADAPYIQPHDEWVLLLAGGAGLRLDGEAEVRLGAGDCVFIAAGRPHWVTWTARDEPTVWLAIHFPA